MTIKIDQIKAVEAHRNGICGAGFYVCDFVWSDNENSQIEARAVVFPNRRDETKIPEYYAVTTLDPKEAWRGDHFIDLVWPEIQKAMDAKWQSRNTAA